MSRKLVTIIGGSGFVGKYIARAIVKKGHTIRIFSRTPGKADELKVCGQVGQVKFIQGDVKDELSARRAIEGADIVIYLVGILHETRAQKFMQLQAQSAERAAKLSKETGVKQFFYFSALAVQHSSSSLYATSKSRGEKAVLAAFPEAVIIRPSLIFGRGDSFFTKFACMIKYLPFIPLIGGGRTKFQPVYAGDIAEFVADNLENKKINGKVIELAGPKIYSFRELMKLTMQVTKRKAKLISIPFSLARLMARFSQILPEPILTLDQVKLLQTDNIITDSASETLKFGDFGIEPCDLEVMLPEYL